MPIPTDSKPGIKTTEFWLSSIVVVLGTIMASGAIDPAGGIGQVVGAILAGLATLGYSYSRGKAKAGNGT